MKKAMLFCIAVLFTFAGLAQAAPKSLPENAKLTCKANADGTGMLTASGVTVKAVEIYYHNQDGTARNKAILKPAATYSIPHSATFQVVFSDAAGTWYTNVDGIDGANAARMFANVAPSQFDGVRAVPDAKHGGIGGPGASLACSHMLRAKVVTGPNL